MPLKIPKELPAYNVLSKENIFVMNVERASHQDIRPLKIGILNLMPIKIQAENQLLRYLSNTPLQVDITLFQTKSYTGNHTPLEHLEKFYRYIDDVKNEKFKRIGCYTEMRGFGIYGLMLDCFPMTAPFLYLENIRYIFIY